MLTLYIAEYIKFMMKAIIIMFTSPDAPFSDPLFLFSHPFFRDGEWSFQKYGSHKIFVKFLRSLSLDFCADARGGGVLPYMGYIGMCGPKGYGFSAVLVINRVSIIAILPPLLNRVPIFAL